jgi:glycosyltransferase involved in cell wall biosynthesis
MPKSSSPRIALVHDWLTGMRGGEKCLDIVARRWPEASLYTLLHRRGSVSPAIEALRPRTSFLNCVPCIDRLYRYCLPVMPLAIASLRLPPVDLILSFNHCVAKGVRSADPATPHVCYCFTPMRYAWQLRQSYFGGRVKGLSARLLDLLLDQLRDWDRRTAAQVTHFVAISETIRQRIATCYGRDSQVIYPPVDTEFYTPTAIPREDFYLVVSALAPYKRIDLAIEACERVGRPLVVIGSGQDAQRLARLAGPQTRLLGWQSDETIRDHLRRCRALLFPGEEDFGIVPVEAMACGTPVIALGVGGATETVVDGQTGLFFAEQSSECLAECLLQFERSRRDIDPGVCRARAEQFSADRYARELFGLLDGLLATGTLRRAA